MLQGNLTDADYLKHLLAQKGISLERSRGQHFLVCDEVRKATLAALEGAPRAITELGAGIGTLTEVLLGTGFQVRAIERDEGLVPLLTRLSGRFDGRGQVVVGDMRQQDWTWPDAFSVVGNIPYNLSGLIVRQITQLMPLPERVVLLVQREVGERLCAEPPNMHLSTLAVQMWGSATKLLTVPRSCFWPAPKVDSELVLLMPREEYSLNEREQVMRVARVFFQERRKQIGGLLRRHFNVSTDDEVKLLARLSLPSEARPQELTMVKWVELAEHLTK